MNVGTGNEAAQFYFWEYRNRIFGTVNAIANLRDFSCLISVRAEDAAQLVYLAIFYYTLSCAVIRFD